MAFPLYVFDNSYIASAFLSLYCDDENSEALDFIDNLVSQNGQIYVPQLFWFEFGNILLNAAKTKKDGDSTRISQVQLVEIMQLVKKLPIYTDPQPDTDTMQRIMTYAQEYNLSFYDATYLELAKRYNIPLKTFAKDLLTCVSQCQ
ncbi:MAG: type II toxin-antitoxin system VapC family toxin [Treponema sp.]|nr:type II toxin-antitoxin system VapC family toxin [Treponema sp.]